MMRIATCLLLALLTGCASYEYDLTQPAGARVHIGTKDPAVAKIPPLRYELITVDSQLVMMIHNDTDAPITLRGDQSYLLDATGRSRNVRGLTIAPGSYGKFIFPPPKPYVPDSGIRLGVGTGIETAGGFHHRGVGTGVDYDSGGPRQVQNLDDNYYWDWDDESAVKFHFVFNRSDGTAFTQDLVINRVKD
jgi:hypothetical protein